MSKTANIFIHNLLHKHIFTRLVISSKAKRGFSVPSHVGIMHSKKVEGWSSPTIATVKKKKTVRNDNKYIRRNCERPKRLNNLHFIHLLNTTCNTDHFKGLLWFNWMLSEVSFTFIHAIRKYFVNFHNYMKFWVMIILKDKQLACLSKFWRCALDALWEK